MVSVNGQNQPKSTLTATPETQQNKPANPATPQQNIKDNSNSIFTLIFFGTQNNQSMGIPDNSKNITNEKKEDAPKDAQKMDPKKVFNKLRSELDKLEKSGDKEPDVIPKNAKKISISEGIKNLRDKLTNQGYTDKDIQKVITSKE
ncbi:MAG: hypothetical protein A2104_00030 [Candidatus Melainabacteria bacterium GWF2_32_7]|nr:MAG: hypothetical protein A2104_00030 [Candidatus Melainabacteria bacterium GWF2_32_7]